MTTQEVTKRTATSSLTEHTITVLLIDDQAMVGEAVRRMLADEEDIDFHFISDPSKAIQTAVELNPTVILQDLVMPEIDGLTLVKFFRAKAETKNIPLIVLSTKEEAVTKAEAFALGANDYLVKLPDKIELLARIRYHSKGYINLLQRNEAFEKLRESQQELADQLSQAELYVRKRLPPILNEKGVHTCWDFTPSQQLSGDSFGYGWLDDDNFAMYVLDVCDHGVGSALLSVSVLNVIASQTLPNVNWHDPGQVLTGLNEAFDMEQHNELYFTMWYGVFNNKTRELTYSCGGHPPALLKTGGKSTFEQLHLKQLCVGCFPEMEYTSATTRLDGPSELFFFSDGVYEITKPSGEVWTFEEFETFMESLKPEHDSGKNEIEQLKKYARELQRKEEFDDDFCMIKVAFD